MAIHHQCTCGSRFTLPDTAIGKKARCRSCGATFAVAASAADAVVTLSYAKSDPATHLGGDLTPLPHRFYGQLAHSFVLPFVRGNIGTLIPLSIAAIVVHYMPVFSFQLDMMLSAYFAAISLETVVHAAAGEADFPDVWIHDWWEDLVLPLVQFIGSWLIVLAPMIILKVAVANGWVSLSDRAIHAAGIGGLLLWPATVLAIAMGNSLSAARPDLVIRTALAAPMAYLAICLGVALAAAATLLPDIWPPGAPASTLTLAVIRHLLGPVLSIYALLVASDIVGLYYLHFKHRFPWQAE